MASTVPLCAQVGWRTSSQCCQPTVYQARFAPEATLLPQMNAGCPTSQFADALRVVHSMSDEQNLSHAASFIYLMSVLIGDNIILKFNHTLFFGQLNHVLDAAANTATT